MKYFLYFLIIRIIMIAVLISFSTWNLEMAGKIIPYKILRNVG